MYLALLSMVNGLKFQQELELCNEKTTLPHNSFVWTDLVTTISLRYLNNLEETYRNIHQPLRMTWLDSGSQRSRSQQATEAAKAATSMLGIQSLSS